MALMDSMNTMNLWAMIETPSHKGLVLQMADFNTDLGNYPGDKDKYPANETGKNLLDFAIYFCPLQLDPSSTCDGSVVTLRNVVVDIGELLIMCCCRTVRLFDWRHNIYYNTETVHFEMGDTSHHVAKKELKNS